MKDFDQTRAADNADLSRFDGRFYDLIETDNSLLLELRRSTIGKRFRLEIFSHLFLWVILLVVMWGVGNLYPDFARSNTGFFWIQVAMAILLVSVIAFGTASSEEKWLFNKSGAKLRLNRKHITDFSSIRCVKAWQGGTKFYLAVEMKNGKAVKIGRFGFCQSENAWRQDAARIAKFLNVPLEIPEV
ncbi:hypothetical protein B1R32_10896 [Abditibacterium utsteinense]|uniref:Uncharacterized protein n=1 Tax=Abditibacterium utsteinense TaxID=1960156 RepID=A0A2S8ST20_9BACT|nr:hypothetical protein [Abditibacterium utsteinense]PQV63889.1 hypothetical protein B1R32_10896 [Abditibacterium utsteinense]